LRIRTVSSGTNTLARIPTSVEYELITADAQEQPCSRPGSTVALKTLVQMRAQVVD
jgi:hypothetical protein